MTRIFCGSDLNAARPLQSGYALLLLLLLLLQDVDCLFTKQDMKETHS